MNKKSMNIMMGVMITFSLLSCSKTTSHKDSNESHEHGPTTHQHESKGHDHPGGSTIAHNMEDSGFIKVKGMYFKLAPDTEAGGDTHLDFYFRDANGKHVTGAKISLTLINPKQKSEDFNLTEDVAGEHYHVKTKLEDSGEYQSVVQVTKDDINYNPRFVFKN